MSKKCSKCKEILDDSCFGACKITKSGLYSSCNDCRKAYRISNKEFIAKQNKKYYERVKDTEAYKKREKEYYSNNREEKIKKTRQYYRKNKRKVLDYQSKRKKEKMKTDPVFKLTCKIRRMIRRTLERKNSRSIHYLGVGSYEEFFELMSKKSDNKNWLEDGYHLDHIWQIHWFSDAMEENPEKIAQIIHNHKNLRPLSASKNLTRLKTDLTPLSIEDYPIYKDILNENIKNEIENHFRSSPF